MIVDIEITVKNRLKHATEPNLDEPAGFLYLIRFKNRPEFYIGSTVNIKHRKSEHLYALRNQKHYNLNLQRLYNTGEELYWVEYPNLGLRQARTVELDILGVCFGFSDCLNLIILPTGGFVGKKHSEETKMKMRVSAKKAWDKPGRIERAREIFAETKSKMSTDTIKRMRDNIKHYNEKIKTSPELKEEIRQKSLKQWADPEARLQQSIRRKELFKSGYRVQWEQKTILNGVEYPSIKEAALANGIKPSVIYSRRSKKKKSSNPNRGSTVPSE